MTSSELMVIAWIRVQLRHVRNLRESSRILCANSVGVSLVIHSDLGSELETGYRIGDGLSCSLAEYVPI